MLHFPSPGNEDRLNLDFNQGQVSNRADGRYGKQANLMNNFITIRVFLKIEDDSNNEQLRKLF